ncbi:hypothetical protein GGQ61_003106 [Phenylobacterium haematophilum]|uniref:DUF4435 domain-containing protein n=1 Tax=Phenylobacterium haematophilum TaxID=98513 RepID=A0A840A3Y0_9CAUL|nr:DUF4435 domain-containing protein [Phenylobacterium haematophilum]MBB3892373.1 hypothetical protein [Phenylobacterium haematophilum]
MMKYSGNARRAYGRLMQAYNDIDVYVEDATYVGIYERVINRALRGQASVKRIIPLGPREKVLEAAMNDNTIGGRPRLYIVDGDLDLISQLRHKKSPHLHRLKVYSLENLLLEESALNAYCAFACPGKSLEAARDQINLKHVLIDLEIMISLYVVALGVARRLDLRDAAFSIDFKDLFDVEGGKHIRVNRQKLFTKTNEVIRRIIVLTSRTAYREAKTDVMRTIERRGLSGIDYVPGKAALWYINERAGHAKGLSLGQRAVASYLADHCSLGKDSVLAARLRRVSRGVKR